MSVSRNDSLSKLSVAGVIVTLGIIYGDIGTSPLYVFKAILDWSGETNELLVYGSVSCVFWTLTLQTTLKYIIITLRADNKGEGGIFSLFTLLRKDYKWLSAFAIIGGSALLADGVITPSITVTSAIEGLSHYGDSIPVIPIVLGIITALFFAQQLGTATVGKAFGPLMFLWFLMLGVVGASLITTHPSIIKALNPYYASKLLTEYPGGILLLGAVFLCTTGAEALYTDLGHCGIKNIRASWIYVKTALVLNYLGQGAWIMENIGHIPSGTNPFFAVMPQWFLPFGVFLATIAAVIASQALISGSFTLISEAISLNLWPKIRIKYPSAAKGQMYIPAINWVLYFSCILVILIFQTSENMEAAYGLSITITMLMTSVLMVFYLKTRKVSWFIIALFILVYFTIEGVFLVANLNKFVHGGWFTVVAASILAFIMVMMYRGRQIRNRFISFLAIKDYLPVLNDLSSDEAVPKYASQLVYTTHADLLTDIEEKTIYSLIKRLPKRADVYWFLHVDILDEPNTIEYKVTELWEKKIYRIDFYLGFKVQPRISDYFNQVLLTMSEEGKINLVSQYPSLKKYQIPADFRFVHLDRQVSKIIDLPFHERFTLNMYYLLKRIGIGDVRAYGLDKTMVSVEMIPLTIPVKSKSPLIMLRTH